MASNLNEYYASKGQALPSVQQRQDVATQAGITGYVGSKEQNASLLGYLEKTPNQSGNNVITSDNLTQEKQIQVKPTMPDTSAVGVNGAIGALVESTKNNITKDQAEYDKQVAGLGEAMKVSGDTSAFDEKVIKDQGVDTSKKVRDNFLSQIEQEQQSTLDAIEETRKTFTGTTAGLNAEIARIQRDSANKLAKYGIGLSSASRDYETASNIANRLIDSNTRKLKADIESRQFVLSQLGTQLSTEKSQGFQLQLKAIDKMDSITKDAVNDATDLFKSGLINNETYSEVVSGITSGNMSLSDFYSQIGNPDKGTVYGYDVGDWATDPNYEMAVKSNYQTMPAIFNASDADDYIKSVTPESPITGDMVFGASKKYGVDPKMVMAMMQQESSFGLSNVAKNNNNPSGITWSPSLERNNSGVTKGTARPTDEGGYYAKFETLDDAVNFQAKWLSNNKVAPTSLRQLTLEENTKLNSTPQSEAIYNGEKFTNALNSYKKAVEKYGTAEFLSATGKGELTTSYQAVVGAIKDYYKLGTLDNGVQKLVELGVPKPDSYFRRDSLVKSGIDNLVGIVANEMNTNAEALALTKYSNSIEGKSLIERGSKIYNEKQLSKMDNATFLSTLPSSGSLGSVDNKSFYNALSTNATK